MQFSFTPEQDVFRSEVRAFLSTALPPNWEGADNAIDDESVEAGRQFLKKLAPKKWIAPAWPVEFGGLGMSLWDQVVFNEEMGYARAPIINTAAVGYLGPTIILYGTDEQKKQHLPGITNGDVIWCQGYSEPNSGSDLASLQTRAVQDGDDFVINGQKIWTSQAHYADWMFLIARTDPDAPKHRGISYFLLDMKTPGITVRPLINMASGEGFNEVFFENVRVPRSGLLGELNRGWYIATTTGRPDTVREERARRRHGRADLGAPPRPPCHRRSLAFARGDAAAVVSRGEHAGERAGPELRGIDHQGVQLGVHPAPGARRHGHHGPLRRPVGGKPVREAQGALQQVIRHERRRRDRGWDERDPAQHHCAARFGTAAAMMVLRGNWHWKLEAGSWTGT
jgi:hypothetical protein